MAKDLVNEITEPQRTIFNELINADVSLEEKSVKHLAEEARVIISAGSTTTAHYLTHTIYHILAMKTYTINCKPNSTKPGQLR